MITLLITLFGRHCCVNSMLLPPAGHNVPVVPAGTYIAYPTTVPPWYNVNIIISRCVNAAGEDQGYTVYGETAAGFYISPIENGFVDYNVNIW